MSNEATRNKGQPDASERERINAWLPADLLERLRQAAESNDRTLTAEVKRAIEEYLAKNPVPKGR